MNGGVQRALFVILAFHLCPVIIPVALAKVLVVCFCFFVNDIQPLDALFDLNRFFHIEPF